MNAPVTPYTMTDELAGALMLLLAATDDRHDSHKVVLKRTAVEVAYIALDHYQQSKREVAK